MQKGKTARPLAPEIRMNPVRVLAAPLLCALAFTALPANAGDGGWADARDGAVGMLLGNELCSGTLIAPNVVLTAGHCIGTMQGFFTGHGNAIPVLTEAQTSALTPAQRQQRANTLLRGMTRVAIADQQRHPAFAGAACPGAIANDVGLVRLAQPIRGIAPVHFGGATPRVGATCETIGFGTHALAIGGADAGRKRRTQGRVVASSSSRIELDSTHGIADHGDSGGPLYCSRGGAADFVYATVSRHCDGEGASHRRELYQNLNSVLPWVRQLLQAWSAPAVAASAAHPGTPAATAAHGTPAATGATAAHGTTAATGATAAHGAPAAHTAAATHGATAAHSAAPAHGTPAAAHRTTTAAHRSTPARGATTTPHRTAAPARTTTAASHRAPAAQRTTTAAHRTTAPAHRTTAPARRTTTPARTTTAAHRSTAAAHRSTTAAHRSTAHTAAPHQP